jgi:hypothetical protein
LEAELQRSREEVMELGRKYDARGESIMGLWGQVQELHKRLVLSGTENERLMLALDRERVRRYNNLRGEIVIDLTQED